MVSKKSSYYLIFFCIWLLIAEGAVTVVLRIRHRPPSPEIFSIGDLIERTSGQRAVTLKADYFGSPSTWTVRTDANRMRIADRVKNGSSQGTEKRPVVLFIGDSVPFGWGVNAEESIPFLFQQANKDFLALNGAVPSYSLNQAVARYREEFAGIERQRYVYLQVYDPVSQFAILGDHWSEDDNWANFTQRRYEECSKIKVQVPFYGEPSLVRALNLLINKVAGCKVVITGDGVARLRSHIRQRIRELNGNVAKSGAKLLVAPVTVPPFALPALPDGYADIIEIFNQELQAVVTEVDAEFIDTRMLFDGSAREDFIDHCCHLSKSGALKVSNEIARHLK